MTDGRWQKIAIQTAPYLEPCQPEAMSAWSHVSLEPCQRRMPKITELDQGHYLMH